MKFLFPGLCWAVLLGGFACAKRPAIQPVQPPAVTRGGPIQEAITMPDPNETVLDLEPTSFSPIYFGFDSYGLGEAWKAAALAEYLKKTGKMVLLSGHASEEGASEYNLALGARRAQAVRDYLEAAGVPVQRIGWVSYGEEAPITHDPDQKSKNRRVEIAILEDAK